LTRRRAQQIVNETLRRVGSDAIERVSTRAWLEDWLQSKQRISSATRLGYKHAITEFLAYLGPRGEHRPLEAITEADIRGFAALLRKEGLSPSTITKLVRRYLSIPSRKPDARAKSSSIRSQPSISNKHRAHSGIPSALNKFRV
jgi:hypothetical protein